MTHRDCISILNSLAPYIKLGKLAKEFGIQPSNLSSYMSGKENCLSLTRAIEFINYVNNRYYVMY